MGFLFGVEGRERVLNIVLKISFLRIDVKLMEIDQKNGRLIVFIIVVVLSCSVLMGGICFDDYKCDGLLEVQFF